ncbi:MAG: hypothetical protein NZM44_00910 [Candidatus Calescibacterium sp.]|nr:hypothetical protein [Candidatus Calescibacterium sp.]
MKKATLIKVNNFFQFENSFLYLTELFVEKTNNKLSKKILKKAKKKPHLIYLSDFFFILEGLEMKVLIENQDIKIVYEKKHD